MSSLILSRRAPCDSRHSHMSCYLWRPLTYFRRIPYKALKLSAKSPLVSCRKVVQRLDEEGNLHTQSFSVRFKERFYCSSFPSLVHYPSLTPIYYSGFHFLFYTPQNYREKTQVLGIAVQDGGLQVSFPALGRRTLCVMFYAEATRHESSYYFVIHALLTWFSILGVIAQIYV